MANTCRSAPFWMSSRGRVRIYPPGLATPEYNVITDSLQGHKWTQWVSRIQGSILGYLELLEFIIMGRCNHDNTTPHDRLYIHWDHQPLNNPHEDIVAMLCWWPSEFQACLPYKPNWATSRMPDAKVFGLLKRQLTSQVPTLSRMHSRCPPVRRVRAESPQWALEDLIPSNFCPHY